MRVPTPIPARGTTTWSGAKTFAGPAPTAPGSEGSARRRPPARSPAVVLPHHLRYIAALFSSSRYGLPSTPARCSGRYGMTSRMIRLLAAGAIGAASLVSVGCGSDPVETSTASFSLRFVPSPSGAGRFGDAQNDSAVFNILSISFRPVDPELDALLGPQPYPMFFSVYNADLARTDPDEAARMALVPGTHKITAMEYRPPRFEVPDASQAAPVCIDRIAAIPSGGGFPPFKYTLDENDGLGFTVSPGQTHVDMVVDVPGLIAAYSAAFTCNDNCGFGVSCLTAYDSDAGRAAFVEHFSFQ